jgi:hypothetical protein
VLRDLNVGIVALVLNVAVTAAVGAATRRMVVVGAAE